MTTRHLFHRGLACAASIALLQAIPISVSQEQNSTRSLQFGLAAIAQGIQFNPPSRGQPRTTAGGASRGCNQRSQASSSKEVAAPLTLLVPSNHDGLTAATRPTLAWYMPESKPVEVTLVDSETRKTLFMQQIPLAKAGIMQVTVPSDRPELAVDKSYRWSVTMICNPNRRSSDVFAQAWIRRTTPNPDLTRQLTGAKSDQSRAQLYASAGFWYDALGTLLSARMTQPGNASIRNDLLALLESPDADLKKVAAEERKQSRAAR